MGNGIGDAPTLVKTLVRTWIAADRLLMNEYKNRVTDKLRGCFSNKKTSLSIVGLVDRSGLTGTSMLMRYVLDQYAYDFSASLCLDPSEFRKLSNDAGDGLMK